MSRLASNKIIKLIFFGNYFYGICAVALSIESSLQQRYPLNTLLYYILAFSATVVYYTNAYIMTEVSEDSKNLRSSWYAKNRTAMKNNQIFFFVVMLACAFYFLSGHWRNFLSLHLAEWALMLVFPIVSALYYGVESRWFGKINLRNIGWLKPFIIGFTWAGLVNIYPILYYCLDNGLHYDPTWIGLFLFIKNFMYITVLCVLFDIKDYAMDYNQQLKTVVVNLGLRKTLFYFVIPLCVLGLASLWIFASYRNFSELRILINTVPFLLIILVAYSMHIRRSIFYYLIIIDGLMLVKALCGITGMFFFD
ncbi:hypothetical protein CNR22_15195 [Sphingobacteriaceae bacterium]|nr:hypothetical protein CNR22_15195 [Sphingobacteriaceae bacterium]